jgi:enoyl-CoA hydratase/carnithine racemase
MLDDAQEDDQVRVIVLAGAGGYFSAGGDITTMIGIDAQAGRKRMRIAGELTRRIVEGSKPVIAAVEGWAVGAGLSLMAACDLVVAAESAKFSMPFGKLGLMPDMGALHSVPARMGIGRTRWMAMTRRTIDAQRAAQWGLVEEVVGHGAALTAALDLAHEVAEGAPLTNTFTKQMLARLPLPLSEYLAAEADAQAILFASKDFQEGADAFLSKRKPIFHGQ